MEEEYQLDIPMSTIKEQYNERYYMDAGYHGGYRGMTLEAFGPIHDAYTDVALKHCPDAKHILVCAGSRGLVAKYLKDKGYNDVISIDISHWAIQNPIESGLNLIEADAAEMPMFKDKQFDFVILSDLLEHVSPARVDMTLKEIARVSSGKIFANIGNEPDNRTGDSDTSHICVRPWKWWQEKLNEFFIVEKFVEVPLPEWFAKDTWRSFYMRVKE